VRTPSEVGAALLARGDLNDGARALAAMLSDSMSDDERRAVSTAIIRATSATREAT
jgi:hypothetical protein